MDAMGFLVKSMTAFAREQVGGDHGELICEIRSVNHRYLDLGIRLPEGLGAWEGAVRERLVAALGRGRVECQITWRRSEASCDLVVDHAAVAGLIRAANALSAMAPGLVPLGLADVMRWPGVLLAPSASALEEGVLGLVDGTIKVLLAHRLREGERLAEGLCGRLDQVRDRVAALKGMAAGIASVLRDRLQAKIAALGATVDPGRLEQEVVLQVQRCDVAEELDRLDVHLTEARTALAGGGPVGRRLDFLMQELNREANTLGAKSPSADVTSQAVAIKVLIEQMREQVQNLE